MGFVIQAAPSAAEVLYQTFKEKKTQLNAKTKASVVDRYGSVGQAPPDEELLLGQTERYALHFCEKTISVCATS